MGLILSDALLDNGLVSMVANCDKIHICSAQPVTYADVVSFTLGNRNWGAGLAFSAVAAGTPNGRKATANAITTGNVTASGTAAFWAAVDSVNLRIYASGPLNVEVAVTAGQVFTLSAFTIHEFTSAVAGAPAGAFAAQSNDFTIAWDAVPTLNLEDAVTGLSFGAPVDFTSFACIVRFSTTGTIDIRNGAAYGATTSVPYTAGTSYHIRMIVRLSNDTYDVYITPQGQSEVLAASNFGFRTEQVGIVTLSYLGAILNTGAATPINMIGPTPVALAPVVNAGSFTVTAPLTSGQVVGTMTASYIPTAWAITAGNSAGYFAISNAGVITVTTAGVSGIGSGAFSLTCRATNAYGNSSATGAVQGVASGGLTWTPLTPAITNFSATDGTVWTGVSGKQYATHNASKTWSVTNPNTQQLRFEVRSGDIAGEDQGSNSNERSEIQRVQEFSEAGNIASIKYEFMLEAGSGNISSWFFICGQIYSSLGASPPFWIGFEAQCMVARIGWLSSQANTIPIDSTGSAGGVAVSYGYPYRDTVAFPRGVWVTMEITVNYSAKTFKLVRNGVTVCNYSGPIGFGANFHWDFGMYRSGPTTGDTQAANYRNMLIVSP